MFKKKVITLALVASMAMTSLVGCGELNDTDVISVVNGEEVTAGVANFYMRMQQAMMETYYGAYMGEDMWGTDNGDGSTYQDTMKEQYMNTLQEYYLARQHAEELGVTLSEETLAEIATTAENFVAENEEDIRAKVSGTKENIQEYLELQAIQLQVYDVIGEGVDTEVSDDEAAQKKMTYAYCNFNSTNDAGETVTMTDDEKADAKAALELVLAEAKVSGTDLYEIATEAGLGVYQTTFDSESTTVSEEFIAAVDILAVNECTSVMETETGYYIGQVTSLLDRDATDTKKEAIISERQAALYEETVAGWVAEVEITLDEKLLSKIDFDRLSVKTYVEPAEEPTEE